MGYTPNIDQHCIFLIWKMMTNHWIQFCQEVSVFQTILWFHVPFQIGHVRHNFVVQKPPVPGLFRSWCWANRDSLWNDRCGSQWDMLVPGDRQHLRPHSDSPANIWCNGARQSLWQWWAGNFENCGTWPFQEHRISVPLHSCWLRTWPAWPVPGCHLTSRPKVVLHLGSCKCAVSLYTSAKWWKHLKKCWKTPTSIEQKSHQVARLF